MPEKSLREFSLPADLENKIAEVLKRRFGLELSNSKEIAASIQKMSDYYIANPDGATPWAERWCQIAQLAYFFPLNYLRVRAILKESEADGFLNDIREVVDFGAGLGPIAWALHESGFRGGIEVVERSADAQAISRELGLEFKTIGRPLATPGKLLTFSYSFTELTSLPNWAADFDSILLLEPSTRQDGRRLLEIRRELLKKNYFMWAPCPHQAPCPLLEKSPSDWCHDRIHFARPDWWIAIEKHLPFQNPTLTFSYLLASKKPSPVPARSVRLVGDLMKEKGKARQMICRGPEREFFAWLSRDGEPPEWPRGILVQEPAGKQAGNEWRPTEVLVPRSRS